MCALKAGSLLHEEAFSFFIFRAGGWRGSRYFYRFMFLSRMPTFVRFWCILLFRSVESRVPCFVTMGPHGSFEQRADSNVRTDEKNTINNDEACRKMLSTVRTALATLSCAAHVALDAC